MIRILAVLLLAFPAFGATVNLGAISFADGATVTNANFGAPSVVDVAPFNVNTGSDTAGPNASFSFTFTFAPVAGVTSASLLISLYDLDSAASGSQVASFTVGGVDLTTTLNSLAETAQSAQSKITYFDVTLPASAFAAIQSGSVQVSLAFGGKGNGIFGESDFNGGGIDFASLTYDTGVVTPEPSSFLLAASGGLALLLRKRYASRK